MIICCSVQPLSPVWLCDPMDCSTPGLPVHHKLQSSLKFMSIESVMPSNHLIHCLPHLLLLSTFPSIRIFSNESPLHIRWPKDWCFSFSISPSSEHPGLISVRMDWLDLLAVQGTLKSLLQHHSSKASVLWHLAFIIVQLLHLYVTTGKTIALTRWTFVGKVMSLLFNMLSRLVIDFLPRSKCLLISWLQSPSAVILEPRKIKSVTVSHLFAMLCLVYPFICQWTRVASTSWLLWKILWCLWVCKYLLDSLFSLYLGTFPKVGLLEHVWIPCFTLQVMAIPF